MNNLSIIIPYYNGKGFIFNCIDSILKSYNLSQKKIVLEIIVIVDSPEEYIDNKMDIAAYYDNPVFLKVFVNERNVGVAASRNKGLELSQSNFITYIDQDDLVNYNYFSVIENQLSDQYHCLIYNGYRHYTNNNRYYKLYFIKPDLDVKAVLKQEFILWTPGLMIINKSKVQIPTYFIDVSDDLRGCDDWAAFVNMLLMYPDVRFNYIKTPIFVINKHAANFSNDLEQMLLCQIAVLNYFKGKIKPELQKIINRIIDVRTFEVKRYTDSLSRGTVLLKHTKIYFKYLCNKWIYLRYPSYKLKKTWYALFEEKNVAK
ncbi:MAG: glycosyltransferase family 2 protein [Dysgonamonadaceae bacterium]|jgi:glycosyltransferase involved in cell wall biosynthesis|nr:glycosyltransferase family 2 protein [Dysgonamonadaceae bacterium]